MRSSSAASLRFPLRNRAQRDQTESVYDTDVVNNIATARYRYSRPDDHLFNFDGNVYWTKTEQDQLKIQRHPGSAIDPASLGDARSFKIDTKGSTSTTPRASTSASSATPSPTAAMLPRRGEQRRSDRQRRGHDAGRRAHGVGRVRPVEGQLLDLARGDRRAALRQLRAQRRDWRDQRAAIPLAEDHRRHHAGERLHGLRHLRGRLSGAGRHRDAGRGRTASARRPGFPNCSPSCRTRACARRSARPRKSASTSNKTTSSCRTTRCASRPTCSATTSRTTSSWYFGPPATSGASRRPAVCRDPSTASRSRSTRTSASAHQGVEFEGTYDAGDWFVGLAGQHIRGRELTGEPAAAQHPAGPDRHHVRRAAARSQAHHGGALAGGRGEDARAKFRSGQERLPDCPTAAYNLVNLYIGYQPTRT